jgi:hypothetical protein
MKPGIARMFGVVFIAIAMMMLICVDNVSAGGNTTNLQINELEYFEAPGINVMVYHDIYPFGRQCGITIIQNGDRIAATGDLRLEATPGQWAPVSNQGERSVDRKKGEISVASSFPVLNPGQTVPVPDIDLKYTVRVVADAGNSFRIIVDLDKPLSPEWVGKVGFNLELFPTNYFGKSYFMDDDFGSFPRQANGPMEKKADEYGVFQPMPMANGNVLSIAPEDMKNHITIESLKSELVLYDGRATCHNGWFVVRSLIRAGKTKGAVEWLVIPNPIPELLHETVICHSQVGYHPDQNKRIFLELDPLDEISGKVTLQRINPDGTKTDVLSAKPVKWGRYLRYDYYSFDFTSVRQPGMYVLNYDNQTTNVFKISRDIYQNGIWQPTLETYFPVQMCHIKVQDRYRVWHAACHMDDSIQAPTSIIHFDSYKQGAETSPGVEPYEHIPGLNRGGWHDAGDYDVNGPAQCNTVIAFVMMREEFGVDTDETTVDRDALLVELHKPDGVPDIIQQIVHGVEWILGNYEVSDHLFNGSIARNLEQYVHLGDGSSMTDGLIYDPNLSENEVVGNRSGNFDDRLVFTTKNTPTEYRGAAALAAASRVLKGYEDDMADKCLTQAIKIWDYEQTHEPCVFKNEHASTDVVTEMVKASAELLITTKDDRYRQNLLKHVPYITEKIEQTGWVICRALPVVDDDDFTFAIRNALIGHKKKLDENTSRNPFGVPMELGLCGVGRYVQHRAFKYYYYLQAFPDIFDREYIFNMLNYAYGCHPCSNTSLINGIGAKSLTVSYNVNRADWSYIPGAVSSGPNLIRPDYPELKEPFAFLWNQGEASLYGVVEYIFAVLAADELLKRK